jgi:hypothetical protein
MPINADTSPNIKFPLPAVKPAFRATNVFEENVFKRIKEKVASIPWGPGSDFFYHTSLGRWESPIEFDEDIEEIMLAKARELYGNPELVKAYHYTVRYQKQNGNIPHLWKHMDQNGCEQTIDICIEKVGVEWGIEVDGVLFPEEENAAVCFYGQQQVHSRPDYPTDATEEDYLTVLFLHYVRPDHWFNIAKQEGGLDKVREKMSEYGSDGDVRYFEYTGEAAEPKLPEGQERCPCHSYREVPGLVKDLTEKRGM